MELGSIWLGGFRFEVLDCPPGTPVPREFTKPTPALFTRAVKTMWEIKSEHLRIQHWLTHCKVLYHSKFDEVWKFTDIPSTHFADSSCLQHFSAAGIQDSHVVCNSSNERWSVWMRHSAALQENTQRRRGVLEKESLETEKRENKREEVLWQSEGRGEIYCTSHSVKKTVCRWEEKGRKGEKSQ